MKCNQLRLRLRIIFLNVIMDILNSLKDDADQIKDQDEIPNIDHDLIGQNATKSYINKNSMKRYLNSNRI